jgi:hypothetical protein
MFMHTNMEICFFIYLMILFSNINIGNFLYKLVRSQDCLFLDKERTIL